MDKFTYKILISSPAHFSGEMLTDSFWLTHAWPLHKNNFDIFDVTGRFHRSFLVLTFREREISPEEDKHRQPPHYDFVGDYFCVFLSAYFGKRFDNLGFIQSNGTHCLPNLEPARLRKLPNALLTSSKPRKDLAIKLELHNAKPLLPILEAVLLEINEKKSVSEALELAFAVGRFYVEALRLFESDPELAFLALVNAGEVLVSGLEFTEDELFDSETSKLLKEIQDKLGDEIVNKVRERLFQIRRRFRCGLSRLVNASFFEGTESEEELCKLKLEDFDKRMAAAYDLRSSYLHAGKRFEGWATALDYRNAEVSVGTPAYGDAEWKKVISRIPTLVGMERVIRFCLLRFLHQKVSHIHDKLD